MKGKFIKAKFEGICAETGQSIAIGENIFYHFANKRAYCAVSEMYKNNSEDKSYAQQDHNLF